MFKKRKGKIKKQKKTKEFISKFFVKVILLVLIVYFLFGWSGKLVNLILSNINCFKLFEVVVKDHFTLEGDDAFEFTRLKPGRNLFTIEINALAKEIKDRYPEFEDVVVKRILPKSIVVLLKERKPIMQIKLVKFYPVDKKGFIVPYAKDVPYPDLPIIIGIEPEEIMVNKFSNSLRIKKAIEMINMLNEGNYPWQGRVNKINLSSLNDITLLLDNIEVKLGSSIQKGKFEKLSQVLDEIKIKSISPGFIDLRFKDVIIGPR